MKLIRTSTLLRRVGGLLSIGHESWSFAFGTGKSESVAKECMDAKYDLVQLWVPCPTAKNNICHRTYLL